MIEKTEAREQLRIKLVNHYEGVIKRTRSTSLTYDFLGKLIADLSIIGITRTANEAIVIIEKEPGTARQKFLTNFILYLQPRDI